MTLDYYAIKLVHAGAATLSITLFLVRGAWMLWRPERLLERWVKIVPHVIDTVLLVSALWLAWQLGAEGTGGWLTAKIVALLLYIVLGTIALKRGKTRGARIVAFVAAVATFGYIVSVALTKSPLGLLSRLPAIPQDPGYHLFADTRSWLGIPHAADVLSNVAFVLVGLVGIARLASRRRARFPPATEASLWCVALGFVGTGIGSAWYHLDPTDATLAWDRLPMTLVFAGVLGAALAQRVGQNVAGVSLAVLFVAGIASIAYWRLTGDLSLYVTLQFGGFGALLLLLLLTRKGDDPFPWWWLIGWYALAKLLEAGDAAIWRATSGLLAGHAMKHVAAAAAGVAVLSPLLARAR